MSERFEQPDALRDAILPGGMRGFLATGLLLTAFCTNTFATALEKVKGEMALTAAGKACAQTDRLAYSLPVPSFDSRDCKQTGWGIDSNLVTTQYSCPEATYKVRHSTELGDHLVSCVGKSY